MTTTSLIRYLQIRGPVLLGARDWHLANHFANRTCHVVTWLGAATWAWGTFRQLPELTGAGPAMIATGLVTRALAIKLRHATDRRYGPSIQIDPSVQRFIAKLADARGGFPHAWQRLFAPPGGPTRLDRMLGVNSREWLEVGAAATLRILGTIERLGPDHLFVRRTRGELEWGVDYGMMQLFRYAAQVERYPDTLLVVAPDALAAIKRLERLANLVDRAISPYRDMAENAMDPLERVVEDLALESLVRVER